MSVWTTESPSKGMTGRKQKLAGTSVRTVVKESVGTEREGRKREGYKKHKTQGGHMRAQPAIWREAHVCKARDRSTIRHATSHNKVPPPTIWDPTHRFVR